MVFILWWIRLKFAYRLLSNARNILEDAGMNLRKFSLNSKELKQLWRRNGTSDNPSKWAMLLK